ncbi:MAG: PQQ-binding-like beta-propeller repeat protein [Opitutales bacterium]|jgi:outer membrane protein assembly factor BamB|nr:PQQ-binding-like beta-propeller repeat protein [Opitutales bacterium]MBT5169551.1 PQQ-binding-like beta-propeller repeat protein [Opitutales bacterium]MBT5812942.1 PQQ-binding-like beta-propeller repeat protein [Opitutales bacterium]MBT6379730.1 PQQ-binding-like beta-propeller repeat protein [Opitutales bacterium]MBT7866892.1 PQQ-binding-like beta-propeller repeat protein [Opitutales bacterium]
MKHGITLGILICAHNCSAIAANWTSWRGETQNGTSDSAVPASFSEDKNLAWKAELPGRGCSTPIVWGNRIFVTTEIDQLDGIIAFDWSGKELWRETLGQIRPGRGKRVGSGANSSPITDGKRLFVYFKSGNFAAFSLKGMLLWKTNLNERYGEDKLWWDQGTSPVFAGGNIVIPVMQTEGDSYLVSFDKDSGKEIWKTPRNYETAPESGDAYTSPHVLKIDGVETIICWGSNYLTGHDAKTGTLLWEVDGFNPEEKKNWRVIASATITDNVAVVPYARGHTLAGIDLESRGKAKRWLWKHDNIGTDAATPITKDGKVYVLKDAGIGRGKVTCIEARSGNTLWESMLPRSAKIFYASPILAGDSLVIPREDGVVFTAKVTPNGLTDIVESFLFETIIASPVAVNDKLLLRSDQHLFCFEN